MITCFVKIAVSWSSAVGTAHCGGLCPALLKSHWPLFIPIGKPGCTFLWSCPIRPGKEVGGFQSLGCKWAPRGRVRLTEQYEHQAFQLWLQHSCFELMMQNQCLYCFAFVGYGVIRHAYLRAKLPKRLRTQAWEPNFLGSSRSSTSH